MSEAPSSPPPEPAEPAEHPDQCVSTREVKVEAVRLSERCYTTVAQIARDRGVPERVLDRWRHELREQAARAFAGKGHQSELEDENRRLKRELELLRQERESLQKAVAIFSRGQPGRTPVSPVRCRSAPSACGAARWRCR
jgi:transposase